MGPKAGEHEGRMGARAGEHEGHTGPRVRGSDQSQVPCSRSAWRRSRGKARYPLMKITSEASAAPPASTLRCASDRQPPACSPGRTAVEPDLPTRGSTNAP